MSTYQIGEGSDMLFGYIYREDGRYSTAIQIENNVHQIASFLVRTSKASKVMITNINDEMEIVTLENCGGYLDECRDQLFLTEQLLPVLLPMQQGKIQPHELRIKSWGGAEVQLGVEGVRKCYNEIFGTNL